MTQHSHTSTHVAHLEHQQVADSRTLYGFWIYIMSDCVLFSCLFAAYAVLHNNTYGGVSSKDIYDLPYALNETFILLTSSFTCGLGMLEAYRKNKARVLIWTLITIILGVLFLTLEIREFAQLASEGHTWRKSAFLSSYFTLVGTHGCHITVGLIWAIFLMFQTAQRGLTSDIMRRLSCFTLFWHFLDIVWVFIFTIVYLMGAK